MVSHWKPFQFFDRSEVPNPFIKDLQITCCTCGRGHLVFGDHEGFIRIYDSNFREEIFQAYDSTVTHLKQLKSSNTLISIGNDGGGTLKIWSLEKKDKDGHPQNIRQIKIFTRMDKSEELLPTLQRALDLNLNQRNLRLMLHTEEGHAVPAESYTSPVSCFDVSEDLNYAALGLNNGHVIFLKGDLARDRNPKSRTLSSGGSGHPVSFVGFRQLNHRAELLVVTHENTIMYPISTKAEETVVLLTERDPEKAMEDDPAGAPPGCVCLADDGNLFVAKRTAIYIFREPIEGGGQPPCSACDGDKRRICWFRTYLIVVTQDPDNPSKFALTIYDRWNRLKVFSGQPAFFTNPSFILSDWGSIFVITNEPNKDGTMEQKLWRLEEKDTQTQLEMLIRKYHYATALDLARSKQFESSDLFTKYADHLYDKGLFDEAVDQYIKTIGKLEPSYVIRKFLDAQRIHNLTKYLEGLHNMACANADHTTLLLNCYTKLKQQAPLHKFIQSKRENYDVETAIKVCRQAGYPEEALDLARNHKHHNLYLKIQIEDKENYAEALNYIKGLSFEHAESSLQTYGKVLVSQVPEETTQVLMDICGGWHTMPDGAAEAEGIGPVTGGIADRSRPELFIQCKCFVDAPYYLMRFLEGVVLPHLTSGGTLTEEGTGDNHIVWNTLLELYLTRKLRRGRTDTSEGEDADFRRRQEKALKILQNDQAKYDKEHALLLCQKTDFKDGILFLYREMGLYQDILDYHMQCKDTRAIISACETWGATDSNMWVQALQYFVNSEEDHSKEMREVLNYIDTKRVLPPLTVIQIVSQNSNVKLDTVKDYMIHRLQRDMQEVEEDRNNILRYKEDTSKMRQELDEMRTSAQLFSLMKCSSCQMNLGLPATHFLCKHSFHQHCLGENEECPLCQVNLKKVMDMQKSFKSAVDNHGQFFTVLKDSQDKFSVISDYFGRGIFSGQYENPPLEGEDDDSD